MPAFKFNPGDVSAGFPIFPKGTYEVVLGEPKSFFKKATEAGKTDNWGVRFNGKIAEGPEKGKKYSVTCYLHNDESAGITKQTQMAALGYDRKQEKEFDAMAVELDFGYNTDDNSCGDGWHKMAGQTIVYDFDVKMDVNGNEQQKVVGIRPFRV